MAASVALLMVALWAGEFAARAANLTRAQAVAALLAPGSGVPINTNQSPVWSPFADFGFGAGFQGLLPAGTAVAPSHGLTPPPDLLLAIDSYFFWVDDLPQADFAHPVRFVLVKANTPSTPTVANGGITVAARQWWPLIKLLGGTRVQYFQTSTHRTTDQPPGPPNSHGLVAGFAPSRPPGPPPLAPLAPAPAPGAVAANNACGLIVVGSPDAHMHNAGDTCESDLRDHYGVPAGRINKVNGGAPASSIDLANAISQMCTQQPPCDKIFIRLISHGDPGSFVLSDGDITSSNLCRQLKMVAAKGVPICMIINSCFSGSLLDAHNWDFPAGSVILTSANATSQSWGGYFLETTNSLFIDAFSKCLRQNPTNNDLAAYRWLTNQHPCYIWTNGTPWYPAGSATNTPTDSPGPQVRTIGVSPYSLNINVINGTGQPKTDFHIIFKNDVRNGLPHAWRSDPNDHLGSDWGQTGTTVTYDATRNETMVCWDAPGNPVAPGQYIHFGYYRSLGGLTPARQYWTPTTNPPATTDRVPTHETTIEGSGFDNGPMQLCVVSRGLGADGWGETQAGQIIVRYSPTFINLADLNLGNPAVTALPQVFAGIYYLFPDQPIVITLPSPPQNAPNAQAIIETHGGWSLNQNQIAELEQIPLNPVSTQPRLEIIRTGPQTLELHWSGAYPLYNVQQTDHLPSATWPPVQQPRQSIGNEFVIFMTIDPAAPPQFFRLSNGP